MSIAVKSNAGLTSLNPVSSLAVPLAVAIGDAVVVFIAAHSNSASVSSVVDDGSNVYAKQGSVRVNDVFNFFNRADGITNSENYNYVEFEVWTSIATAAATKVTANLNGAASVAVALQSYTGANATAATAFPQQHSVAIANTTAAPSVGVTSPTSTSYVCTAYASAVGINDTVTAGTQRQNLSTEGRDFGLQIIVADIAASVAAATALSQPLALSEGVSGEEANIGVTYAGCAVEVHV